MRTTRSNSLLSLNDLRGGLATDGGLHDSLDIGDIDSVTRDLSRSTSMSRLGWPSSRTTVSSVNPGICESTRLISTALIFEHLQIGAVYLYGQRAFQAGQGFVDGVFGGLREVENNARIGIELLLQIFGELGLIANRIPARICPCRACRPT